MVVVCQHRYRRFVHTSDGEGDVIVSMATLQQVLEEAQLAAKMKRA